VEHQAINTSQEKSLSQKDNSDKRTDNRVNLYLKVYYFLKSIILTDEKKSVYLCCLDSRKDIQRRVKSVFP
jgi:hypothetical protein